jgi:hypothetical protein
MVAAMVPAVTRSVINTLKDLGVISPPAQVAAQQHIDPTGSVLLNDAVPNNAPGNPGSSPATTAASFARPLALSVDSKIKGKIWAGEFINFQSLISSREVSTFEFLDSGNGSVTFKQAAKPSGSIRNIDQWFRAFHIFVSVYTQKYAEQAPDLMKYADTVQRLSKLAGEEAALYYDEEFRRLREAMGDILSFKDVHMETYNQALAKGLFRSKTRQPAFKPKFGSKKVCFAFNSGNCKRRTCSFAHLCQKCNGGHPKRDCSSNQEFKRTANTPKPYNKPL